MLRQEEVDDVTGGRELLHAGQAQDQRADPFSTELSRHQLHAALLLCESSFEHVFELCAAALEERAGGFFRQRGLRTPRLGFES